MIPVAGILILALLTQEANGVFVDEATGEVTLTGQLSTLVEHSTVRRGRVLDDMVVYKGRLFGLAACHVLAYLPESDQWRTLLDTQSGWVYHMRVVAGKLMIPMPASKRIVTFDGHEWEALDTPEGVRDVGSYRGKLFFCGGNTTIYESGGDGKSWTEVYRAKEKELLTGRRDVVEFQGKLYTNDRGKQLVCWDGKSWQEIPVTFPVRQPVKADLSRYSQLFPFADRLLAYQFTICYVFDGKSWTSMTPGFVDLWREGATLYGLKKDGHVYSTRDAKSWSQFTQQGVPAEEIVEPVLLPPGEWLTPVGSLAVHRGRLFVGTSAAGKIYASPYVKSGKFVSKPVECESTGGLVVEWETVVPAGAKLSLRVRTADQKSELEQAAWTSAPERRLHLPKARRWVQYAADLESDGGRTPLLKWVRFVSEKDGQR